MNTGKTQSQNRIKRLSPSDKYHSIPQCSSWWFLYLEVYVEISVLAEAQWNKLWSF